MLDAFLPLACELRPDSRPAPAPVGVIPLGAGCVAVVHPVRDEADADAGRFEIRVGGRPAPSPLASSRLRLNDGGLRHVALIPLPDTAVRRAGVEVRCNGRIIAALDADALQTPIAQPMSLAAGLSTEGAARLLRLLLATAPSLFAGDPGEDFAQLAKLVLSTLTVIDLPHLSFRAVGREGCIASYRMAPGITAPRDIVSVENGRPRLLRQAEFLPTDDRSARLEVYFPKVPGNAATLICLGDTPLRLGQAAPEARLRDLSIWHRRASPEVRARVERLLVERASTDPMAAAQVRELNSRPGDVPRLTVRAAACTPRGLLYAVSIRDPRALAADLRLTNGTQEVAVPISAATLHPSWGPVQIGFALFDRPIEGEACRFEIVTKARRILPQQDSPITPFDGTPPDGLANLTEGTAVRAMSAALSDHFAGAEPVAIDFFDFGRQPSAPDLRLLIDFDRDLDALRAICTAVALERQPRGLEIVFLLHDPEQLDRVSDVLADLHELTNLPLRLALPSRPTLEAECVRAVSAAGSPCHTIHLRSGTIPQGTGWLSRWHRRLGSANGPRLLGVEILAHTDASRGGKRLPKATLIGFNANASRILADRPLHAASLHADLSVHARDLGGTLHARDRTTTLTHFAEPRPQSPLLEAVEAQLDAASAPTIERAAP